MPGLKRVNAIRNDGGKRKKTKLSRVVTVTEDEGAIMELKRQQTQLGTELRKLKNSVERKYHDELSSEGIVNNINNEVSTLCDPAQGLTVQTRTGDEIQPTSLQLGLRIRHNGSGLGYQQVRVILIQAKERFVPDSRQSTPDNAAVLAIGGAVSYNYLTSFDWNNRKHFTVLFDKTYTVDDVGTKSVSDLVRVPVRRKVRFEEAGSTTGARGQIYMIRYSSEGANGPYMQWHSRVTFIDV